MRLSRFHLHTLTVAGALAVPAAYEAWTLWDLSIEHRRRADWMAREASGEPAFATAIEQAAARYDEDARRFAIKADRLGGEGWAAEAATWRGDAARMKRQAAGCRAAADLARRRGEYWGRLQPRYDRAARFPFLPLPPDPPEPR